ncbi:MAG TPA: hypothetical protein DEQ61_04420 [Streptomyces sp.]|nr:hypothetical protein [Streptomyces sp.]
MGALLAGSRAGTVGAAATEPAAEREPQPAPLSAPSSPEPQRPTGAGEAEADVPAGPDEQAGQTGTTGAAGPYGATGATGATGPEYTAWDRAPGHPVPADRGTAHESPAHPEGQK